jgi:hypothetical protein
MKSKPFPLMSKLSHYSFAKSFKLLVFVFEKRFEFPGLKHMKKSRLLFIVVLLCIGSFSLVVSCAGNNAKSGNVYQDARTISSPYAFPFVLWEVQALSSLISDSILSSNISLGQIELANQIRTVLADNGISTFPPLNFNLEKPPYLLVISPRDKIQYMDRMLLRQTLNSDDIDVIESKIDNLGLSSLVVRLGGFAATYPPIVDIDANRNFIIDTVVEEWFHQYLAFKPLGFLYLLDSLGFRQDSKIIVINETLAGMVSDEISSQVMVRYYGGNQPKKLAAISSSFNFNKEMKETRENVDIYLGQGDIDGAERYMTDRRNLFLSNGYQIRKLNQAYFAFHGIYGQSPASVSPVHRQLQSVRDQSQSLKEFLQKASAITNYEDLVKVAGE